MIEKNKIQEIIKEGLMTGADFAEIFFENTNSRVIKVISGEVASVDNGNTFGAGIRLIKGTDEVYGYTNKTDFDSLVSLVKDLRTSFKGSKNEIEKELGEALKYKKIAKKTIFDGNLKQRTNKLIELSNIMKNASPKIVQAVAQLLEKNQEILVCNSKGVYQTDLRTYVRLPLIAVAQEGNNMQQAFEGPGRFMGIEIFDKLDFNEIALDVANRAVNLLNAKDMVSQTLPVVLHNGFGGVIFHEACGHPLEAVAIAKGLSPFTNKLGEKVGSDIVNAYDDGTLQSEWGFLNFDDEGHKTQRNLLIENGVLKGYLVDYKNGMKMDTASTGSSRRQSYKFSPTSRMNSTFIAPGTDKFEDIIKDTKYGLFAKNLGGGTVQPATGEFNFAVAEGYMIEDGKITYAIKGAMLIGQGSDVLFKIDKIADNLAFGQGMCGASSGSIPVDVGQPTIRVSSMTVGGSGGTK